MIYVSYIITVITISPVFFLSVTCIFSSPGSTSVHVTFNFIILISDSQIFFYRLPKTKIRQPLKEKITQKHTVTN